MTAVLAMFGANPLGGLAIAIIVPVIVVAFGSYVGVLMALQTFFGESSWEEVVASKQDDG